MNALIVPYLSFNGNCREAMNFYRSCLGGKLSFQTIGESPLSGNLSTRIKNYILHATLTKRDVVLMGTDLVLPSGLVKGNTISLSLCCASEAEIKMVYSTLSSGGRANHPLEHTFWGALQGDLTDKYGHHWLLHYDKNKT